MCPPVAQEYVGMNKVQMFPVDQIPEGCKHLYGALFVIPFLEIRIPDAEDSDEDYKFKNPRMLTEKGQNDLFDKKNSLELRESIKTNTLLNPLVCRWVKDGDDQYYPQLVGGDRRYRALDFLIRKKEIVRDPRSLQLNDKGDWLYNQCSADVAYNSVPCQIFAVNSDLDALALAWAENKGRINLTEGHEIAEVIKLRKFGASDEKILEILQRDEKWLASSDSLIATLDQDTLSDLLENRITRDSARELGNIQDETTRNQVRLVANQASKEACERKIKRMQRRVEASFEQKEIAEGSIADAEFQNDEEAVEEAKIELFQAEKKVSRSIKERDKIAPVTTAKDVKKAAAKTGVKLHDEEEREDVSAPSKVLSARKIRLGIEYLEALIENEGDCLDDEFKGGDDFVYTLRLLSNILENNILANEPNFQATIKRHLESQQ